MNAGGIELAMRKRYDKEFKAKVALEALKGEKTLQELGNYLFGASEHDCALETATFRTRIGAL